MILVINATYININILISILKWLRSKYENNESKLKRWHLTMQKSMKKVQNWNTYNEYWATIDPLLVDSLTTFNGKPPVVIYNIKLKLK